MLRVFAINWKKIPDLGGESLRSKNGTLRSTQQYQINERRFLEGEPLNLITGTLKSILGARVSHRTRQESEEGREMMALRQAAVAGAALVLVIVLTAVVYDGSQTGPAALAEAAAKGGKAHAKESAAAAIKGLQGTVDKLMQQERKEGSIARKAMMQKEAKELQLEDAENGLAASAEGGAGSASSALAAGHQSIQEIKDAIEAASKRADKAKAARKKLQQQLDKELNQLAQEQFAQHEAAANGKAPAASTKKAATKPAAAAVKGAVKKGASMGVAHKVGAQQTMKEAEGAESILASMDVKTLELPKVRAALKQSLDANELKIADEVAKSLGAQMNITGVDEAIVAEVAVATAEKEKDIPLLEDGETPALNFTAPPLADALLKEFEQAQKEVDIETGVKGKKK